MRGRRPPLARGTPSGHVGPGPSAHHAMTGSHPPRARRLCPQSPPAPTGPAGRPAEPVTHTHVCPAKLVRNLQTGHPGAHAGPRALSVRGFLRLAEDHGRSAEGGSTPGSARFPLPAPGLCPPLPSPGPRAGPGKTRGPLRGREPGARDLSWAPKPLRQGLGVLPVPCGPRVCGFTGHLAGPTAAPGRPPRGNATGERRLWAARRALPAAPLGAL